MVTALTTALSVLTLKETHSAGGRAGAWREKHITLHITTATLPSSFPGIKSIHVTHFPAVLVQHLSLILQFKPKPTGKGIVHTSAPVSPAE